MPIILSQFEDPTSINPATNVYAYAIETNFNLLEGRARIVYGVWRSTEDANANVKPLGTVAFDLTPEGIPSFPEVIAANPQAFYLVGSACDNFAIGQPFFASGTLIPL